MKQIGFIRNKASQGDVALLYSKGPLMTDLEFLDAHAEHFDASGNLHLPESQGGKGGNPDVQFCSPPPINSALCVGLALGTGKDGVGVCALAKKSNLDKGDLRVVRRGLTVDYMGLRCLVQRVRVGMWYGKVLVSGSPINLPCGWVRVVV